VVRRSGWERAASVATVLGVVFAVIALWLSYWTFQRQTDIQANQAAHNATQAHLRLRVEHPEIINAENQIEKSQGSLDALDQGDYRLYVTVAQDGIAMAEYVYKLWRGDPGWEDTVESWIVTYRPFLLDEDWGLDCGDWDPKFVRFIRKVLRTSSEDFCYDQRANIDQGAHIGYLPLVIAAAIIVLVVLRMFVSRSG
jgi:hypothetical protein